MKKELHGLRPVQWKKTDGLLCLVVITGMISGLCGRPKFECHFLIPGNADRTSRICGKDRIWSAIVGHIDREPWDGSYYQME
uniref:Uncharacterized protein n=1 Tax=Onchocerca volvulus TaxID=6282 RepID=A0A8R1TS97_ONCVO